MTDSVQMSRKELLEAKKRVSMQIDRLEYGSYYSKRGFPDAKTQLMAELQDILTEINAELAELDS